MVDIRIIGLAADHAGFKLKEVIKNYLIECSYKVLDLGTNSDDSVDYPDYGHSLANAVENNLCDVGISVCGSGNGINMAANKHQGIRSALCWNEEIASLAKKHNLANICALPGRFVDAEKALSIVRAFISAEYEGGRHQKRIEKIPLK